MAGHTLRRTELDYTSDLQRVDLPLVDGDHDHKYHIHSHELDHIEQWVTELLGHSRKAAQEEKRRSEAMEGHTETSVDFMKEQVKRYTSIAQELTRQTTAHSPKIATLLSKTWSGMYAVTKGLIDNYDAFVGRCKGVEKQMLRKIKASDAKVELWRRRIEEADFAKMVAGANLRAREADIETLHNRVDEVEAENRRLRRLVGAFIEGRDPDQARAQAKTLFSGSAHPYPTSQVGQIGQRRVKNLYELDDKVSELLSKVSREGQKQQKILSDMQTLFVTVGIDSYHMNKIMGKKVAQRDAGAQTEAGEDALADLLASMQVPAGPGGGGGGGGGAAGAGTAALRALLREPAPPRPLRARGSQIPIELRALMAGFPATKRIPSEHQVLRGVLEHYAQRLHYERQRPACRDLSAAEFLYAAYEKKFGEGLVDQQLSQLVLACSHYKDHRRVKLFGGMIGVGRGDAPPALSKRDCRFLLDFMQGLAKEGELQPGQVGGAKAELTIDLLKVLGVLRSAFWAILPDSASALLTRVQFMTSGDPRTTNKAIDFDDLMELVASAWGDAQALWRRHLEHLFEQHCAEYQVAEEMRFAADKVVSLGAAPGGGGAAAFAPVASAAAAAAAGGLVLVQQAEGPEEAAEYGDKDSVLVEISKEEAKNKPKRKLRNIHALIQESIAARKARVQATADRRRELLAAAAAGSTSLGDGEDGGGGGGGPSGAGRDRDKMQVKKTKGGRSREVVGLIDKPKFSLIIKKLVPGISQDKLDALFEDAQAIMHQETLREFERIWTAEEDSSSGQTFYCNIYSNTSQWAQPYNPDNFWCDDIDLDSFIKACLDNDLMQSSPFVKIFNKSPEDFLSNWEAYNHQVQEGTLGHHGGGGAGGSPQQPPGGQQGGGGRARMPPMKKK